MQNKQQIDILLDRGVSAIYPSRDYLKSQLESGKKLSLYFGIDPTGEFLHIGHALSLKKIRDFQLLGHKIILLIGDFTAMIGDPTDKKAVRQPLTREQILHNCNTYKEQASKILDFSGENPVKLVFNSEWLSKLSFQDVIELSAHFTVQQMLERDMFENRLKAGKPIGLHEFLYPLMQGYDSVAMEIDGEIGGNDQMFNMMTGRTLSKQILNKEKFVITMKLLEDPSGKKMGKSEGNIIALNDTAEQMLGKVMSWTDGMIFAGFELCTDVPMQEIEQIQKDMDQEKLNPRDAKIMLAQKIVEFYHNKDSANKAVENFNSLFKDKKVPTNIKELKTNKVSLIEILVEAGFCSSNSDARRNIEQGGVRVNENVIKDIKFDIQGLNEKILIQKGKRHFIQIIKI